MSLRGWIKRLEREAQGDMASFELLNGSRYYFDPMSFSLFLHFAECLRAGSAHNWPEPPEVVRKLTEAKDIRAAIEEVNAGGFSCLVYDEDVLINERRLVPRGLITRYDPHLRKHVLREPYEESEDLSE